MSSKILSPDSVANTTNYYYFTLLFTAEWRLGLLLFTNPVVPANTTPPAAPVVIILPSALIPGNAHLTQHNRLVC